MTAETLASPKSRLALRRTRLGLKTGNGGLFAILFAAVALFTLLGGERFVGVQNLRSMAFQLPEFGILALAMMITLLTGGLNLAVIATSNLCALTMAWIMVKTIPDPSAPAAMLWALAAVAAGLAVAGVVGLVMGTVIAYLNVSPILTSLGMMSLLKGPAIGLTHGTVISGIPPFVQFLGSGTLLGLPVALFIFALCAFGIALMLGRSPVGTFMYLIGSNERAARYSGINTRFVLMRTYVLSSLLCGVAALIMLARFNSANATYGESYLLGTILAAALGGVDPDGGFGKVSGLVLALIILQVISSAFNQLGISQYLTLAIWGAILLVTTARRA
jgi:simple sugar transport system permease protein